MTQVHFTLKSEEIQCIIQYSVKDDVSKNILTTVFNQLMENQRTEYIQAIEYERTEKRQRQRNGFFFLFFSSLFFTLFFFLPISLSFLFSPTVFSLYLLHVLSLFASIFVLYFSFFSSRYFSPLFPVLFSFSFSLSFFSLLSYLLLPFFFFLSLFLF
ncbi:transposase, partial [Staphylococcus aureus]|uniref:transposase n=1 Tax=Staphylococcus aureus TaxID=1280 RepID=UPI0021CB6FC1